MREYFTVVQWDQRATGKTFLLTDPGKITLSLTTERMISDVEEMVEWARHEFATEKIFLLGHSYGSFLALQFAQRHPNWIHAYIGVGQSINGPESERRGWRFALDAAHREGNLEAVRESWRRSRRMLHLERGSLLRTSTSNGNGLVTTAALWRSWPTMHSPWQEASQVPRKAQMKIARALLHCADPPAVLG
jgi:pimeloyl-ACP methyl ester carboxylesterase